MGFKIIVTMQMIIEEKLFRLVVSACDCGANDDSGEICFEVGAFDCGVESHWFEGHKGSETLAVYPVVAT